MANTYTTAYMTLKETLIDAIKLGRIEAQLNHKKIKQQADADHAAIEALIEENKSNAKISKQEIFSQFDAEVIIEYFKDNEDKDGISAYYNDNKAKVGTYYADQTVEVLTSSTYATTFEGVNAATYADDTISLTYAEGIDTTDKIVEFAIAENGYTAIAIKDSDTFTIDFTEKTLTKTTI